MDDSLYAVRQVSIILKVHPLTVRRYIKEGRLKAVRIAGNIRIPKAYLDSFTQDFNPGTAKVKTENLKVMPQELTPDDPIFRLKGKGLIIRGI